MNRPTTLLAGATQYWVLRLYDPADGLTLINADSTPTVAVRKNGSSTGDSVTVTKRSSTTGIYDCSYNPSGESEGDKFTIEETATISSTAYSQNWEFTVVAAERGTDSAALNSDMATVLTRLSSARAGYLDNLSAGAVALNSDISTLLSRLSSARAGYLDNLSAGAVALNSDIATLLGRIIGTIASGTHSPQSGDAYAIANNGTYGNSALNTDIDALLARLTSARAGYLDNLSGGAVATSSEVTAIQNNTRVVRVVPDVIERPDSGTTTYRVELLLYDAVGNMEAPDSAPTIELVNQAGTSRASRLDSATMTLVETGRYRAIYTADSADTLEQLVWTFSVTEGGATRKYGNQSLIVDTTAVDFTAADRTKLDTIYGKMPTRPYLAASTVNTGAILPSDLGMAAADLDSQLAAISTDVSTLLGRITSTLFSGITSLAQWLGLMAGKQTGNTTARNEMRATGGGSGTYSETTDSLEALRDRGDAAWTTGSGGGGGGDANLVSVNGIPVETGQINITVVNTTTVQQGTLVLYRSADYSVANGNPILFTDVANIDSADNLYLTIVDNQAETAVFTRKVAAAFSEVDETATFAATAAELTVDSGKNYAFVVERKFGTEYNPILWGPCTIKDNNRTFPS